MKLSPSFLKTILAEKGSALLAILMFVAVLTLMLLSYLISMQMDQMSTNSYSHSIRAQEVGLGGIQEILADLNQEMNAGSLSGSSYTVNNKRVYMPSSNLTATPARIGFALTDYGSASGKLPPTLIRASRAVDTFYTSPPSSYDSTLLPKNFASAASSITPSANNRVLTAERWNKPLLLGLTVPSSFYSAPATNKTPDWVYITRSGRKVCTDAEALSGSLKADPAGAGVNAVLGRYAYMIYDESALLDINVAGYPSSASVSPLPFYTDPDTGITHRISGKSNLAYTDLTQLPGLAGKQAAIDKIIAWRNKGALTTTSNDFLKAIVSYTPFGFLSYQDNDNPILGRQDLINFFTQLKTEGSISDLSSLPYLSSFSRSVNAPSWGPSSNSSALPGYYSGPPIAPPPAYPFGGVNNIQYLTNAEVPVVALKPNANRNMANIRIPKSVSTIKHYKDDGSSSDNPVEWGDALLQRRFSLSRLNWLTHNGPASGKDQAIRDCFGLRWGTDNTSSNNPCWVYDVHGTGTPKQILTLDKVADLGREPDFFEMLKAAILSGSLGRDPGIAGSTLGKPGVGGTGFDTVFAVSDAQIIQIGANLIDQWDTNSYPTAIYFKGTTLADTPPSIGPVNVVYGIENLPYFQRTFQNAWLTKQQGTYNAWYQFELWNPFQVPVVTTERPSSFNIRAYGQITFRWTEAFGNHTTAPDFDPPPPSVAVGASCAVDYDTYALGKNEANLFFSDSNIPSSFVNPAILTTANAGAYVGGPIDTATVNIAPDDSTDGGRATPFVRFLGLYAGHTPYSFTNIASLAGGTVAYDFAGAWQSFVNPRIIPSPARGVTFCLSYWDGTRYLPYTYMSRVASSQGFSYGPNQQASLSPGTPAGLADRIYGGSNPVTPFGHVDPLTDRFSTTFNDSSHAPQNTPWSSSTVTPNRSWQPTLTHASGTNPYGGIGAHAGVPMPSSGFVYWHASAWAMLQTGPNVGYWVGNWAQNNLSVSNAVNHAFYADPDGVVRPGNDYRWNPGGALEGYKNGDGMSQVSGGYSTTTGTGSAPTTTVGRRPLILNRPFRSVGEMGYAYRDLPFKSLDFFSPYSADSALLDVFSITDEPAISAGKVNISNASIPVLQALLKNSAKQELDATNMISNADALAVSTKIYNLLNPSGLAANPLRNPSDLVNKLSDPATGIPSGFTTSADKSNKTYIESPLRSLAPVSNTRTWNLMIDIIAQSGRMSPTSKKVSDFMVEGERRYWLHVAIDRYTGKVVHQQLEPVYE